MSRLNTFYGDVIISHETVRTIHLTTPEECLNANKIIDQLVSEGHQIIPSALYPGEIRISYISKNDINIDHNLDRNLIVTNSENICLAFTN